MPDLPKIAYAVSIGAMGQDTEEQHKELFEYMNNYDKIMVRDEKTFDFVLRKTELAAPIVCDPTMLVPISELSEPIRLPKQPYLFVYTYGIDSHIEHLITHYAKKRGLLIVSACFWHRWADKTIECSPLQLSSLLRGADCVFTSTFHGALFTMMNHKRCCILPVREKVRNVVVKLGMEDKLIDEDCSFEQFERIIQSEFNSQIFDEKLLIWRHYSEERLGESFECLAK